jgi:hypothetical protein
LAKRIEVKTWGFGEVCEVGSSILLARFQKARENGLFYLPSLCPQSTVQVHVQVLMHAALQMAVLVPVQCMHW